MMAYPPFTTALLQGLATSLVMLVPPMFLAFGGKLKTTGVDVLLLLCVFPAFAALTIIVFYPFDGDWAEAAVTPLGALRSPVIGGVAVVLGVAVTQWKALAKRGAAETVHRVAASFLIGALWGGVWRFSGWCLQSFGVNYG